MFRLMLLALLAFLASRANSQDSIRLLDFKSQANFRNAKEDTIFDWYTKHELELELSSGNSLYAMYNRERENGAMYWSYQLIFKSENFEVDRFLDTETGIEYLSGSVFYTIYNFLKLGYNFSVQNESQSHNAYVGVFYKDWFKAEVIFLTNITRYKASLTPDITLTPWLSLGLDSDIMYANKTYKWNVGPSITINIISNQGK